jgi:hypothetical protein
MRRVSAWIDARSVPFMVTMVLAVAGSSYSLFWSAVARHGWQSYSDLWNSSGVALAIGHGHFTAVYAPISQIDSPPGFEYLLAPVMVVGHALGLGTVMAEGNSFKVFGLVLAAVATAMGCTVLFALDAIARAWEFSDGRRLALSVVAGLGVVSAAAFWGHPEDCIALAFVLWAALLVERRGVAGARGAGWLLGVAVACQPLALLALTPVIARFAWRPLWSAASRVAVVPVAVLLPAVIATPSRAIHAVVDQPFFPPAESSTPFSHLARALGHGMYSGGTLRLVATLGAIVLGWVACRRRCDLPWVLFVMAIAFTLRVVLESELLGFYFYPVVALALLLSLRSGWSRLEVCAVLSVVCLALGNRRQHAIALWWPAIMLVTVAMLVVAYRGVVAVPRSGPGDGLRDRPDLGSPRVRRGAGVGAGVGMGLNGARSGGIPEGRPTISHVRLLDW